MLNLNVRSVGGVTVRGYDATNAHRYGVVTWVARLESRRGEGLNHSCRVMMCGNAVLVLRVLVVLVCVDVQVGYFAGEGEKSAQHEGRSHASQDS